MVAADFTSMSRYDADGTAAIVGVWTRTGIPSVPVGDRVRMGGRNMTTLVYQTGKPGADGRLRRGLGCFRRRRPRLAASRSAVGVPISVGGRLWGVVNVGSAQRGIRCRADTEARLAGFTELVGTAIANAEAQAALAASRARIVAAADEARRRIERDLHDGAQQRLVTLALRLREAQADGAARAGELATRLDGVAGGLDGRAGGTARDRPRHPPGGAGQGRAAPRAGGTGPPLPRPGRACTSRSRDRLPGPGGDRRLLRGLRGADQHRQARPRHRRRGRGGRRRGRSAGLRPRRRARRRGLRPAAPAWSGSRTGSRRSAAGSPWRTRPARAPP